MKILFATDDVLEVPYDTLVGVNLDNLALHKALLEDMDLHGTSFAGSYLRGAILAKSNLTDCNFSNSSLITAYLMHANLKGANLRDCKAMFCNFISADLNEADVQNADFSNCNFKGAVITCRNASQANFVDAVYDSSTVWPDNFDPVVAGCIYE